MNDIEEAVIESKIENAENRIRMVHNSTCKLKNTMPYQNIKFINMIDLIHKRIEEIKLED